MGILPAKILPSVLLPDNEGHLVYVNVTKCDNCRAGLVDREGNFKWKTVQIIDDAVRPLYLCSEKCKRSMEAKIKDNKGYFPNEKLRIDSLV